jgi:hypothetical protein
MEPETRYTKSGWEDGSRAEFVAEDAIPSLAQTQTSVAAKPHRPRCAAGRESDIGVLTVISPV